MLGSHSYRTPKPKRQKVLGMMRMTALKHPNQPAEAVERSKSCQNKHCTLWNARVLWFCPEAILH